MVHKNRKHLKISRQMERLLKRKSQQNRHQASLLGQDVQKSAHHKPEGMESCSTAPEADLSSRAVQVRAGILEAGPALGVAGPNAKWGAVHTRMSSTGKAPGRGITANCFQGRQFLASQTQEWERGLFQGNAPLIMLFFHYLGMEDFMLESQLQSEVPAGW